MRPPRRVGCFAWLAVACGPAAAGNDDAGTGTTAAVEASTSVGATIGASSSVDATTSISAGSETSNLTGASGFIGDPDGGVEGCDPQGDDCPRGEKCMPWASDGGHRWNATRCTPVADDAAQHGEPCTVQGSPFSGIDDCAAHAMCWDVDGESLTGTCAAFCMGPDLVCPDGSACIVSSESIFVICDGRCDPLLQDCTDGDGCYPDGDAFRCWTDASDGAAIGDPCELANGCAPGSFCANADVIPTCGARSGGCCSRFCDTSDADADLDCDAALPGTACVPWFEAGQAPPGLASLGACMQP